MTDAQIICIPSLALKNKGFFLPQSNNIRPCSNCTRTCNSDNGKILCSQHLKQFSLSMRAFRILVFDHKISNKIIARRRIKNNALGKIKLIKDVICLWVYGEKHLLGKEQD